MGMFDYVNFSIPCPHCGHEVEGFQSKSGDCCLETIEPWTVNNFYSGCDNCGAWIDYSRVDLEYNVDLFLEAKAANSLLRQLADQNFSPAPNLQEKIKGYLEATKIPQGTEWMDSYIMKVEGGEERRERFEKLNIELAKIKQKSSQQEDEEE